MLTETQHLYCPYCGEKIEILVDVSIDAQSYIEDCSVCCRPIELSVTLDQDDVVVLASRDDD